MLEAYVVKPETVDRVRGSWIASEIEGYIAWLAEEGYGARSVWRRVPLLVDFGEFARLQGATSIGDLPTHVDAFVAHRVGKHRGTRCGGATASQVAKEVRGPVEQMLGRVVVGFEGTGRRHREAPFAATAPGFFDYLVSERGLRPTSLRQYRHHLDRFEAYLGRVGVGGLQQLSPAVLSAFVADRSGTGLAKSTVSGSCGVLRVFLRYANREGLVGRDLSGAVEWPQSYRLSSIPRSISWAEVEEVLGSVDRRTPCGKRDYALLLLLVTYGLRGREVVLRDTLIEEGGDSDGQDGVGERPNDQRGCCRAAG